MSDLKCKDCQTMVVMGCDVYRDGEDVLCVDCLFERKDARIAELKAENATLDRLNREYNRIDTKLAHKGSENIKRIRREIKVPDDLSIVQFFKQQSAELAKRQRDLLLELLNSDTLDSFGPDRPLNAYWLRRAILAEYEKRKDTIK